MDFRFSIDWRSEPGNRQTILRYQFPVRTGNSGPTFRLGVAGEIAMNRNFVPTGKTWGSRQAGAQPPSNTLWQSSRETFFILAKYTTEHFHDQRNGIVTILMSAIFVSLMLRSARTRPPGRTGMRRTKDGLRNHFGYPP